MSINSSRMQYMQKHESKKFVSIGGVTTPRLGENSQLPKPTGFGRESHRNLCIFSKQKNFEHILI